MNESTQRKSGVILSYVSIVINIIIQLLFIPLLIRFLGQSEYGLYSLVTSIIGYLTLLDLGFSNAIIVFTAKYRAEGKFEEEKNFHGMFLLIFKIIGFVSIALGLLLYLFADNIFANSMSELELHKMKIMILILTFNMFISFSFGIYNSIIVAYEKFTFQKVISILSSILKPLIMIPFLFMGFKSITMCIIITIVNIIILRLNYLYCKNKLNISIKFKKFNKKMFIMIFSYSIWLFVAAIIDKANWSIDNFILGVVSGTFAVSIYSVGVIFNQFFMSLSVAISGVFLPKITKMISNKVDNEVLTEEFIKIGRLQYYILFLMCSGFVLLGKNFIELWVGPEFSESYYVSLLLIIPMCIPLIQNLGLSITQAMNKYKFIAITNLIIAVINVAISVFLTIKWGAIGAALGTAIALIIGNGIIINIYYHKAIKLDMIRFWKNILKMTICFTIPVIAILIIMKLTNLNGITNFILYGSIYTIIYIFTTYFIVMNSYEKEIIKDLAVKLKIIKKDKVL